MTHRVSQIIDAIAELVRTRVGPHGGHVYTHRRESLSPEQDELPAYSVDIGELEALEEADDEIYWALSCTVTALAVRPTELEVKLYLFDVAAREIHRAIMANPAAGMPWAVTLGLAFVITARPQGWDAPEYDVSGENIAGGLTTKWRIEFKTDVDDPGDG